MRYLYPAKIMKAGPDEYVAAFRDVPEALTSAATKEGALREAKDALIQALLFYLKDRRPVPAPSRARKGEVGVAPDVLVALKAAVVEAVKDSPAPVMTLARALRVDKKEAMRILDPEHPTKAARLEQALAAFGAAAVIDFVPRPGMTAARAKAAQGKPARQSA